MGMSNDIRAWIETAQDLELLTIVSPDGRQVVIMNQAHPGRGYLWVTESRLMSTYSMAEPPTDRDAGGALATLGRLARKSD